MKENEKDVNNQKLKNLAYLKGSTTKSPSERCLSHSPTDTPFSLGKNMYRGFFPLWRKITDWGWYTNSGTKAVFIHLLLKANFRESDYRGHKIKIGQCVSGRQTLSASLGMTERQIRTALKHLKATGEVSIANYNRFSIITLNNFEKYLPTTSEKSGERPARSPKEVRQTTTYKEVKNVKNDKNTISQITNLLGSFPDLLTNKVGLYLDRVRLKNKSKVMTEGRKATLLTELFNSKERCKDDGLFGYALDMAINYDACNIGYINAIVKNKKTDRP